MTLLRAFGDVSTECCLLQEFDEDEETPELGEEEPPVSPEVEEKLFVYSDCMLDPEAMFREVSSSILIAPRHGRLLVCASFCRFNRHTRAGVFWFSF